MKIAVIGGGPSGLVASINAKNNFNEVYLFDKNPDFGKKLLLTGNGKCNYWNEFQDISKYHSTNNDALKRIITTNNLRRTKEFLDSLGIIPNIKNGYYYPFSNQSASIKTILVEEAMNKGVIFKTNTEIKDIIKDKNFKVYYDNLCEEFDVVVIATGSKSYKKTGSDGYGYNIAKSFNINVNTVTPSLVQLVTDTGLEKKWAGIRALVKININEKEEEGEIQFTDYGISGICVFNISRNIAINLANKKKQKVKINFIPWFNGNNEEFLKYLNLLDIKLNKKNISNLCDGFLNYKLTNVLASKSKIDNNKKWSELTNTEKMTFINNIHNLEVDVIDTKGFDNAQVCSGGISLDEINYETLETKKVSNLYFCGEVLDVDGDCGGYNLSFAFLSGLLVGRSIYDKSATSKSKY